MNRFKGLDPVKSMPEELWTEVCNIVQKAVNKPTLTRRQSGYLKKRSERQRRKGKIYPTECRAPNKSKERQEGLLK